MALPTLTRDFSEFLKLLNSHGVEYLLIGAYAVGIHGYVRVTNDLDVWIRISAGNATRAVETLREFGFSTPDLSESLFLAEGNVVRMGLPPMRLEFLASIAGVEFDSCFAEKIMVQMGDLTVPVISLPRLRQNKRAAARSKDLADLDNLPT